MRVLSIPLLVLVMLAVAAGTPRTYASADEPTSPSELAKVTRVTTAEVNRAVTPPGGVKAIQTGGNTVGDVIRESRPRADGYRHIDTPATIRALQRLGVNTYIYLVWNSPTDWSDLTDEFAPAAERAGIRIWVYLVPPSECLDNPVRHLSGRCSRPYTTNYVKWAEEIAKLSKRHPNVVAWALDDFFSQLSPDEIQQMKKVQDEINPLLGFYTTVYYNDAIRGDFYDRYEGLIDGIIYPYTGANSNTQDASQVGPNLDKILAQTEPRGIGVVLLAYTGRYLGAIKAPNDRYIADVIGETLPYMKSGRVLGITLYGLPIADQPAIAAYDEARTGSGWLTFSASVSGRTAPGDEARAEQRITVDPSADRYGLELSTMDAYADEYADSDQYHDLQILVDGTLVRTVPRPTLGGVWHRQYIDLTKALQGKGSATLAIRVLDDAALTSPTRIVVDDVRAYGFRLRDGGFEAKDGWTLSANNAALIPSLDHMADFAPSNALQAATAAFAGRAYVQPDGSDRATPVDAMVGNGRLRLSAKAFEAVPAGACAIASQTLTVDPRSPRYELDFFQWSTHAPFSGQAGRYDVTVRLDDDIVWERDANAFYPFWENGNGLQGPIDVTDIVGDKTSVRLSFRICALDHSDTRPGQPVDIGFDNLRTVGLHGRNLDFESANGWTMTSSSSALAASVQSPSRRTEAPPVSVRADPVVARAGTTVAIPVRVENSDARPASGRLTATVPAGWTVEPTSTPYGPIAAGGSATVTMHLAVPADAKPGSFWPVLAASSGSSTARVANRVQVIGDTVAFTPGTTAEAPWLVDPDGSQLDGEIYDGHGRFADGSTHFTYRFDLPADVTGGTLTLNIGNEYLVDVSSDGRTWRTILREDREIHDRSNLADHAFDLSDVRQPGTPLYVRVQDAKPDDGWGGWLGHLTLTLSTTT